MQRKNNILKSSRNAIAMIMAIMVIVTIATIMALSLALTTQSTKRTNDLYLYEQASFLSKSATEYALLKIAQDGACTHTNDLNFVQDSIYDINITLQYVYVTNGNPCTVAQTYTEIRTPEQNGSILIDVAVSVNDITVSTEPIRYFRRTIQKL
ncbi:hypothetical protein JHD49_04630 [Sulfurimonas sp. SAG-AH-194-C21]|nr:hypothetical protein [Sulfurimonas sp. SAG-AH-194-C21]MDF1883218.1 hypothetical protein [Sulfurimonas sp. SAG-AH-194-C21]